MNSGENAESTRKSKQEWRKAFWVILISVLGTLVASVLGLIFFNGLPSR